MSENVLKIGREGAVATVVMNRPSTLNAMSVALRRALLEGLAEVGRDRTVRAVVLAGEGRGFCSGADLVEAATHDRSDPRNSPEALIYDFNPIVEALARMDKPIVAAVQGGAVGVGMSFALACDFLFMAEDAYLMPTFLNIGLVPDGGATWSLVRRLGYPRALEILAMARRVPAPECDRLGLVNRVVPAATLRSEAQAFAAQIAARPPIAMVLTKRLARLAPTVGLAEFLSIEAEMQGAAAITEDSQEAIAAFAEKRPAVFKGR